MQTAKTLTIQCLYPGWSESRLFVHLARFPAAWILSYPFCCCENTDQPIIKRRCSAWCSNHLAINLFVSSADKLYKIIHKRSDMLSGLIWIQTVWHSLIIFPNSLEIDQTEYYTPARPGNFTFCSPAWEILLGVFKWLMTIPCGMRVRLNYELIGAVSTKLMAIWFPVYCTLYDKCIWKKSELSL